MRVLCITDQFAGADHSSIEGIFGSYLRESCEVTTVYFTKESGPSRQDGNRLVVPYRLKHGGLCAELARLMPLDRVDVVIVRNFFPVLRDLLGQRERYGYRVGFWHSFPHTYRRLFEAQEERRSLLRKTVEYRLRSFLEHRLVRRCDFLMAMSDVFRETFHPDLRIPFFPLPMGIDCRSLPAYSPEGGKVRRYVYTGTVDGLRKTDVVVKGMLASDEEFVCDFYTRSDNDVTNWLAGLGDRRIRVCSPLPRQELLATIATYDVGIGLIPENRLYRVSSPTKTLEYYGIGMPAIINFLPEYEQLFDEQSAFFCPFTHEGIVAAVRRANRCSVAELRTMGERGRQVILQKRNYRVLAHDLQQFLQSTVVARGGEARLPAQS